MNKLYMKYWLNKIENNIIDNENYKIKPIHFITYGDSKFQKSKNRLLKEAEEFNIFQTVKGYGLGEAGEGRNITHQQKKLNISTDSEVDEKLTPRLETFEIDKSRKN